MSRLNEEKLSEVLDIDVVEAEVVEIQTNLSIDGINTTRRTPDALLTDNIERANRILDILEKDATDNEQISARKAEVMAQLINAVTNAANSIISDEYNKEYLQIRNSVLLLKEKELRIKELGYGSGSGGTSDRLIITDRESILKIIKEGKGEGDFLDVKQLEEGES